MLDSNYNLTAQKNQSWLARTEAGVRLILKTGLDNPTVADVGCGDGKLLSAVRARGLAYPYVGFDINPQNPDVLRLDATRMTLPATYDVVVSLGVTEYLDDVLGFFKLIKPRCSFFIVSHVVSETSNYTAPDLKRQGWTRLMTSGEMEALLDRAGLAVRDTAVSDRRTKLWLCAA